MVCGSISKSMFKYKEEFQNFAIEQKFPNAIQAVNRTTNDNSNTNTSVAQELLLHTSHIRFSDNMNL
jgi:hypothetical protein